MKPKKKQVEKKISTLKNPWFYSTIVLMIIFAGFILYDRCITFHKSINAILKLENTIVERAPVISLTVLGDESIKDMPYDLDQQIAMLKEEIDAEISTVKIDISSPEAEDLIEKFDIKTVPILIFDSKFADTEFYADAAVFFTNIDGNYVMRTKPVKFLQTPKPENGHARGAKDVSEPILIIAYNSLSCPYCTMMKDVLYEALEEYQDKVLYVFKHFNRGGIDIVLANAAECAGEQDKFWEMHDYILDNQNLLRTQDLAVFIEEAADTINIKNDEFNNCVEENRYQNIIEEQTLEAHKYGISGTPAMFINETFVGGAIPYDKIQTIIDSFIQ